MEFSSVLFWESTTTIVGKLFSEWVDDLLAPSSLYWLKGETLLLIFDGIHIGLLLFELNGFDVVVLYDNPY